MADSWIEVVVLGVMSHHGPGGETDAWVDIARPDTEEGAHVSVPLPVRDRGLATALRHARRRRIKLRVPADFFDRDGDKRLTQLRDALKEALRA
jgi:hypothetical protein